MSLGIISFALLTILALIPMILETSRESIEETRAASIARSIAGSLRGGDGVVGRLIIGPNPGEGDWIEVELYDSISRSHMIVHDEEGNAQAQIAIEDDWGTFPGTYLARVTLSPDPERPGFSSLLIEVVPPTAERGDETTPSTGFSFHSAIATRTRPDSAAEPSVAGPPTP